MTGSSSLSRLAKGETKQIPDQSLCTFQICRFLGKVMSQYISVCVSEGVRKAAIISDGFNYERWKKTASKSKQVHQLKLCVSKLHTIGPVLIALFDVYVLQFLQAKFLIE